MPPYGIQFIEYFISNLLERFDCKGLDSSSTRELSMPASRLPTSSLTSTALFDAVIKQSKAIVFGLFLNTKKNVFQTQLIEFLQTFFWWQITPLHQQYLWLI